MLDIKKNIVALLFTFMIGATAFMGCGSATGGDRCESDAECDSDGLECVTNFAGIPGGSCNTNQDQPLICHTACATDADCANAEFGHKPAPKCIANCNGDKSCIWDPEF